VAAVCAAIGLLTTSCRRVERRSIDRLAILPFENLTGDRSLDWVGQAISGALAYELSASAHIFPVRVSAMRDALALNSTRVMEGYYTRSGRGLSYRAVIEDAASHKDTATLEAASGIPNGVAEAANGMSRSLDKRQHPFPTRNASAIRFWGEAQLMADPAARAAALEKAIAADPNFGLAYVDRAQVSLENGDRAGASRVVSAANQRLSLFTDVDRARIQLQEATLNNRRDQQRTALRELSRLSMTDSNLLQTLAGVELALRHFDTAADTYKNVLALEPDNVAAMNALGYVEAYRGNLEGATSAMDRYQVAAPDEPNPLDSLGEVHFMLGKFAEAERYFLDAYRMNAAFLGGIDLLKAAECRLMLGNLTGADEFFQKYSDTRRNARDPVADIVKLQWAYMTGRRKQTVAALESGLAGIPANVRSYAEVQLAVWKLDLGDRPRAAELAAAAAHDATNPQMAALAAICRFIVEPRANASEWAIAAERTFSDPGAVAIKQTALAYGLLYAREFAPAAQVFKALYEEANPAVDGDIRTLYAWALVQSGHSQEARPLVQCYPIMLGPASNPIFSSLVFPRFLQVRGMVLKSNADLELFQKYAGDAQGVSNSGINLQPSAFSDQLSAFWLRGCGGFPFLFPGTYRLAAIPIQDAIVHVLIERGSQRFVIKTRKT
jgi:tetratricopeptide (TPR) repeat protein